MVPRGHEIITRVGGSFFLDSQSNQSCFFLSEKTTIREILTNDTLRWGRGIQPIKGWKKQKYTYWDKAQKTQGTKPKHVKSPAQTKDGPSTTQEKSKPNPNQKIQHSRRSHPRSGHHHLMTAKKLQLRPP